MQNPTLGTIGETVLHGEIADEHGAHHVRLAHRAPSLTIWVPVPRELQVPQ